MPGGEDNTKQGLPPRSIIIIFGAWLFFAIFSAYKGMKQFKWPEPLSYRGMTVVLITGIVIYLAWRLGSSSAIRKRWQNLVLGDVTPSAQSLKSPERPISAAIWFVLGLCFLGAALAFLEYRAPYFFAQDDNLSQFLPVIMQGCESLFTHGEFPTYNPNQFAGAPTSSVGTYALTYPGTYLSYWIAKVALGAPEATIDVFCVLHLIYGYPILFALLRRMGCGAGISTAGALSFLLQGFFLINGRSWFYMMPTALWAPCLFLLAERLRQGAATRLWPLGTGLAIGAYFHSGNVQMWVYSMSMWVLLLAIWLVTGKLRWSAARPIFCALLIGFGVALPLLVPQFAETASARRIIDGASIDWTLGGLYFPWPLFQAKGAGPALFGTENHQYVGQFMYSGTTFIFLGTLIVMSMVVHSWNRKTWGENAHAPLAFIAFLIALGQIGFIWFIFSKVPIFSKFAHPFKFLPLLTLMGILAGAIGLERILRRVSHRTWLETAITAVTLGLIAYHVSLPLPSAFSYGFKPFPKPMEPLRTQSTSSQRVPQRVPQRVMALAPYRHAGPNYGRMPVNNLPTAQGLYSILGYDPIVMRREPAIKMLENLGHVETYNAWGNWRPTPWRERPLTEAEKTARIAALRAYGVDTVFSFGAALRPPYERTSLTYIFYRGDQYLWQMLEAVRSLPESERQIVSNNEWGVTYRITGADPLAFLERDSATTQSIRFTNQGAVVELRGVKEGDFAIVNVIDEPGKTFLHAYVDGKFVAHEVDQWLRVRIPLPADAKKVEVRYEPPFLKWLLAGLPIIAIGALLGFLAKPQQRIDEGPTVS